MLPDLPGLQLAELAVNENTAVLLTTGHPDLIVELESVGQTLSGEAVWARRTAACCSGCNCYVQ
jgi:hypothetical protein